MSKANNFYPLFKIDDLSHKLLRRVDVLDIMCDEYTDKWYGLSTLIKLYVYHCSNSSKTFLSGDLIQKMKAVILKATRISNIDFLKNFDDLKEDEVEKVSTSNLADNK